ncbi:MAG: hypothetical protein ACRD3S_11325, partial [Terracidiphilus sp.]
LLCTVAIVQTLYAYPIAGSQAIFIQIPLVFISILCAWDFARSQMHRMRLLSRDILQGASVAALLCAVLMYGFMFRVWRGQYRSLTALNLPGAYRIHVPETQRRDYVWLTENVDKNCDAFIGMPELPSLHIWTAKDPVGDLDMNNWMLFYSDKKQENAAQDLSRFPKACEIYNPDLVAFWNRTNQDMSALPLARYLDANFRVVGQIDKFSFLMRKNRNLDFQNSSDP